MESRESYPETIGDLTPDERNPRTITDAAASGLQKSLTEFGDISSIVFSLKTGRLIAGHQRVRQLALHYGHNLEIVPPRDKTERGWIECPNGDLFAVRFVDWDQERARLANVAANNQHIAGEWDDEALGELLGDLKEEFGDVFDELRLTELFNDDDIEESSEGPAAEQTNVFDQADELQAEYERQQQEGVKRTTIACQIVCNAPDKEAITADVSRVVESYAGAKLYV